MKNSIMRDAVGCIGDDLISAADEKNVIEHFAAKRRRVKRIYAAACGLAACLVIAVMLKMPTASPESCSNETPEKISPQIAVENNEDGDIKESLIYTETVVGSELKPIRVGDEAEGKHGKLKYISSSDGKVSFLLDKQDIDEVIFIFEGYYDTVSGEMITRTLFKASTSLKKEGKTVDLSDKMAVYVNGSLVTDNSLPSAPGRYEITIDLSGLTDGGYKLNGSFTVTEFGTFSY